MNFREVVGASPSMADDTDDEGFYDETYEDITRQPHG
jgi:hypothetical protein